MAMPIIKQLCENIIEDTGWINIEPIIGTKHDGYYVPRYRKVGNIVFLKGIINNVTERNSTIFTLPKGFYEEDSRLSFSTTNDDCNVNLLRVLNDGRVILIRSNGNYENGIDIMLNDISYPV